MKEIVWYIYKKYGVLLTEEESKIVIKWYQLNADKLTNEDILDREIQSFIYKTFKNKKMHILAEDTSNMKYLLTLLKKSDK